MTNYASKRSNKSESALNPDAKSLSFWEVWSQELAAIKSRRQALYGTKGDTESGQAAELEENQPPTHPSDTIVAGQKLNTVGLCLSGGGIRSAAFNLGVLQAFAQQRLISNLDYLSTVSGGGYIGSWLTTWIRRDGDVKNIEQLLNPSREVNALANRDSDKPANFVYDKEPEPIVHLRANSNYLALRPGILTPDSWALLAIYLRNIILNSLVLLPGIWALVFLTIGLTRAYKNTATLPHFLPIISALVLTIVAARAMARSLAEVRDSILRTSKIPTEKPPLDDRIIRALETLAGRPPRDNDAHWYDRYLGWTVVLTVLVAYLVSLDMVHSDGWLATIVAFAPSNGWKAVTLGIMFGFFHLILNRGTLSDILTKGINSTRLRWVVSGFAAGFVMGASLHGVSLILAQLADTELFGRPIGYILQSLLAVPLIVSGFFLAEAIQLGVLGKYEDGEVREKWSAFQSRCFMAGLIWMVLVLHVYFISTLVPRNLNMDSGRLTAMIAWIMSALGSIHLAQGSTSQGALANSPRRNWSDLLIMAGPPIFLSGILAVMSALAFYFIKHEWLYSARISLLLTALIAFLLSLGIGAIVDINVFSLQELYQSRLVRCFLGASRRDIKPPQGAPFRTTASFRDPDYITSMDPHDDLELSELRPGHHSRVVDEDANKTESWSYNGPLHLINVAVNLTRDIDLQRQERRADNFTLSPIACGNPTLSYRPTHGPERSGYATNIRVGTAVALSGAAVSPNMGYYSSPAVTALLTVFNVRLGAWLGNPRRSQWQKSGPIMGWLHLIKEMMGLTDSHSKYIYISDGGHFDNLAVYELLRRRCNNIFASDAGADPTGSCNELGMIIRKAFTDFGIVIDIDVSKLSIDPTTARSESNVAMGTIHYPAMTLESGEKLPAQTGMLIYIKMTRTGNEPTDIVTYQRKHPEFPHTSTVNQFYTESQFESYRHLGYYVANQILGVADAPSQPRRIEELRSYLKQVWSGARK